jgi:UPF0716 family protein affecting phage T7 exclusion
VLRRLPLIICAVVVLDFVLWATLCYWCGWKPIIIQSVATTVIGLTVIVYYEWRWSEFVAKRLEAEPATLDVGSFEKILLLIAGIVFLIPGIVTDFLGLFLLMPKVRRGIVHMFQYWG